MGRPGRRLGAGALAALAGALAAGGARAFEQKEFKVRAAGFPPPPPPPTTPEPARPPACPPGLLCQPWKWPLVGRAALAGRLASAGGRGGVEREEEEGIFLEGSGG